MQYDLKDKVAVVTGASRGIGRGIALELAKSGASVIGTFITHNEAANGVKGEIEALGGEADMMLADVSLEQDVKNLRDRVIDSYGSVHFVVNNAGIHQHLKSWELTLEDWNRIISTNLTGTFLMSKAFTVDMKMRKYGRIVNISSCASYTGTDHEVHYAASKGGINSFTKSLALELSPFGINVNAVSPGFIDTDMLVWDSDEQRADTEATIPLQRIGEPADIGHMVAFLCSPGADYITGQMFHVNGGLVMP